MTAGADSASAEQAPAKPAPPVHIEPSPAPPEVEPAMLATKNPVHASNSPGEPAPKQQAALPSFDSPQELLASKGLTGIGDFWSLPEESELNKRLTKARTLWREVLQTQREVEKAQETVARGNAVMLGYVQTMGQLGAQLKLVRTVADNNRIVGAMNEMKSRIVLAQKQFEGLEESRDLTLATALSKLSEFEEHLLESRALYDKAKDDYQDLSADTSVAEAIRQFNRTSDTVYQLGPRSRFVRLGAQLGNLESKVFSESIALRRGDGGLWYVPVVFNGQNAKEMAIDTGASVIAVSWTAAQQLKLTFAADDPVVYAEVADGSVVPCRRAVAEKVRVGKFTVENVECMVMMPSSSDSTPLLGLSFLKNFSFRIDSGKGQLIMSQIDTSED